MTGRVKFIEFCEFGIQIGIGIGIEVGMTGGSVQNSMEACVLCIIVIRGLRPPYKYSAKYTSLPRVFDTPSCHSNFNPNLNSS